MGPSAYFYRMNLIQDIREYRRIDLPRLHQEVEYYKNRLSSLVAIQQAALGHTPVGNQVMINPHQRRPPKGSKPIAMKALTEIQEDLLNVASFEELFLMIKDVKDGVNGVGPLWAYDTALRIGWYLNLYPNQVFIHAGAKQGAKILLETNCVGMENLGRYVSLHEFPKELHSLAPFEVENFLCLWNKAHK